MTPDEPLTVVSVQLHLRSQTLTAAMIAERLRLEPTTTYIKGAPMVTTPVLAGELVPEELLSLRCRAHAFILTISRTCAKSAHGAAARMLESLLDELLTKVEPVATRLDELRDLVSADIFCDFGFYRKPESFTLSESLLRRIGALNLPLTVSFTSLDDEKRAGGIV